MTGTAWRYAVESVAGTSHLKRNLPCQDASLCRLVYDVHDRPVLVSIVADGAGSAAMSQEGAEFLCSYFVEAISYLIETGRSVPHASKEWFKNTLLEYQDVLTQYAAAQGRRVADYASTLLVAIIGVNESVFAQIGDGVMVVPAAEEPGEYGYMFWPQTGEYYNQTFFATDRLALDYLNYRCLIDARFDEVALLSDGLERLALHYASQQVHTPFFMPLFEKLRLVPEESLDDYRRALHSLLVSDLVNKRTDDDKTLILATRRGPQITEPATRDPPHDSTATISSGV